MALDVGELLVSIKADLTDLKEGLNQAGNQIDTFGTGAVVKGTLIADAVKSMGGEIARFAMDSLKAYGENEAAVSRLETALRNAGLEVKGTSAELQAYAQQLQRTTIFSDETSMEMMALLTTFGLSGDEMKRALKAAMDLSQGMGIDLRTAVMMLGKAAQGETGTLARYGIVIGENVPKAQAFNVVLKQVEDRFGGSMAANMNTVNSRMASLKNQFEEVQEVVGKMLLPVFEFYANKLTTIAGLVDGVQGTMRGLGMAALEMAKQVLQVVSAFGPLQSVLSAFGITGKQTFDGIDEKINEYMAKLNQWGREEAKVITSSTAENKNRAAFLKRLHDDEERDRQDKLKKELEETEKQTQKLMVKYESREQAMLRLQTFMVAQKASVVNAYLSVEEQEEIMSNARKLQDQGKTLEAKQLLEQAYNNAVQKMAQDTAKAQERMNQKRMHDLSYSLSYISTLSRSTNKTMLMAGKAAAIAETTINAYTAATGAYKALSSIPYVGPALGIAAAAAALAAGMANVSAISRTELAEGGIVLPKTGGVAATLAEAGKPEAVIPLDDAEARSKLRGAFGGGPSISITINGNFIEGSPAKMQKLVRESLIPEIRRYTDHSPQSLIPRRRGRSS